MVKGLGPPLQPLHQLRLLRELIQQAQQDSASAYYGAGTTR
jgi:hypothetical protein